jgi:hypothetical protein
VRPLQPVCQTHLAVAAWEALVARREARPLAALPLASQECLPRGGACQEACCPLEEATAQPAPGPLRLPRLWQSERQACCFDLGWEWMGGAERHAIFDRQTTASWSSAEREKVS